MEKLSEEGGEAETPLNESDVTVQFPKKSKYDPLPTGEAGAGAAEQKGWLHDKRKLAFILIIVAIVLIAVILSIVFLLINKASHAHENLENRFMCHLAGKNPTEERCKAAGCNYFERSMNSKEPSCVYAERNQYYIAVRMNGTGYLDLLLKVREDLNLTLDGGDFTLAPELFARVLLTPEGALRVTVSLEEIDSVPDIDKSFDDSDFIVTVPKLGKDFSLRVERRRNKETLLSTSGMPLVVTEHLTQFAAKIPGKDFRSNGLEITNDEETFLVWNGEENMNLPAFYGSDEEGAMFGVASLVASPAAMVFSRSYLFKEQRVGFTQLGGDVDLLLLPGPAKLELTAQLTSQIGTPFLPPFWSLGSILFHGISGALTKTEYPVDVVVMSGSSSISNISSTHILQQTLPAMQPVREMRGYQAVPLVYTATGDPVMGSIVKKDDAPGAFVQYLDFTVEQFDSYFGDLEWSKTSRGCNFEESFPTNHADQECADNIVNNSPFLESSDPLYKGTLCLDALHSFNTSSEQLHRDVHNSLGMRQAKLLHNYLDGDEGVGLFLLTDSTTLGAGQFAAIKLAVTNSADLKMLIPRLEWYGDMGIHAVPIYAGESTDKDLVMQFHKISTLLPFSTVDEEALLKAVNQEERDELMGYTAMKYHFYPLWLTALFRSHTEGTPVIRPMSSNYPTVKRFRDGATDMQQFMVGDNAIVYYGGITGHQSRRVYLPPGSTWWQYGKKNEAWSLEKATTSKAEDRYLEFSYTPSPERLFLLRGASVVGTGVLLELPFLKQSNVIEQVRSGNIMVDILLCDFTDSFNDTMYLVGHENSEGVRAGMSVHFQVDSTEDGVSVVVSPDVEEYGQHTEITFDALTVIGIKRRVVDVTLEGRSIRGSYVEQDEYVRVIALDGKDRVPLVKDYHIRLVYEEQ